MHAEQKSNKRSFLLLCASVAMAAVMPLTAMAFTYTVKSPHTKQSDPYKRSVGVSGTYTLATGERAVQIQILAYDRIGNLIGAGPVTQSTLKSGNWQARVTTGTSLNKYQVRLRVTMTNGTTVDYRSPLYTF